MGWEELKGEDENEHATEENVSLPSTHRIISLCSCSSCCSGTGTNPIFVADRLQDSYPGATHSAVRFESVWAAPLQQMGGMEVRGKSSRVPRRTDHVQDLSRLPARQCAFRGSSLLLGSGAGAGLGLEGVE